ncbi:hypothetical protein BC832DRAFT_560767 [Gaertneriomyces semiglobifer]|nr:hypothetical protein BC832DRAFT_560767 [Gaertneriomyces semiglobifer]
MSHKVLVLVNRVCLHQALAVLIQYQSFFPVLLFGLTLPTHKRKHRNARAWRIF